MSCGGLALAGEAAEALFSADPVLGEVDLGWRGVGLSGCALTLGQRFEDIRFLIRDRGSNSTTSFDAVFQAARNRIRMSAVQAPRMNATCERLVRTLRHEVLDRTLILSEAHLRAVLTEYQTHYNTARPHQGIAQHVPAAIVTSPAPPRPTSTPHGFTDDPSWAA